jgi:hypothetical protein
MEARLGHRLEAVRIHSGEHASAVARTLHATAFTVGEDIVIGDDVANASGTTPTLAHELTHVVQQRAGNVPPGVGDPTSAFERAAAAGTTTSSPPGQRVADVRRPREHVSVQRQYAQPTTATTSDPDALIPIADFIRYVEVVEAAFGSAPPEEILTRIRQEYYMGPGFDELVPDAPRRRMAPGYAQPPGGGTSPIYWTNRLVGDMPGGGANADALRHLTAHADENGVRRNPSPYIVMPDGSHVDAGHLLLGLDSLLHPRVAAPFSAYGIPGIDPAGLAADLALASFWTTYHQRNGSPAPNAARRPQTASFDEYYAASAPDEDLLGDIDAFSAEEQSRSSSGQRLSQILRATYLGTAGPARVRQRFRTFAARNSLGYSQAGASITWDLAAIEAVWLPRIDRLCDLFDAGFWSLAGSVTVGTSRSRGTWPYSREALRRFLAWLKPRLEAELATP